MTALNRFKPILFRPISVLTIALVSTFLFGILIALIFRGERRNSILIYSVPIGIPFVAFLFDRAQAGRDKRWFLDAPILILAFLRSLFPVPLISGHALFLTYALLTGRSKLTHITTVIIFAEVIYFKAFVWQDATLIGGTIAGLIASFIWHRLKPR